MKHYKLTITIFLMVLYFISTSHTIAFNLTPEQKKYLINDGYSKNLLMYAITEPAIDPAFKKEKLVQKEKFKLLPHKESLLKMIPVEDPLKLKYEAMQRRQRIINIFEKMKKKLGLPDYKVMLPVKPSLPDKHIGEYIKLKPWAKSQK